MSELLGDDFWPYEGEWYMSMHMGIGELRMLYSHISYSLEKWPGYPARPIEEQEYLKILKSRLFAMITEYQFYEVD